MLDPDSQRRMPELRKRILANFSSGDWRTLGAMTNCLDVITNHPRLLRSLSWGDEDYDGHATEMLVRILEGGNLTLVEHYLTEHYPVAGEENISSVDTPGNKIYFTPNAFVVPGDGPDRELVSVMMPFEKDFDETFNMVEACAQWCGLECKRASDIWEHSVVIQDIFSLIYRSYIVVCDFTSRNANVFYEAGIAHTLGKHVIPITQSPDDIPFDLKHHRYLHYLNNKEGRNKFGADLTKRFEYLKAL
jgi:hypothetical protein